MKNPIKAYREWRNKRFVERIDKLYFNKDNAGNLFIKGHLHAICDGENKGGLTAWPDKELEDMFQILSEFHSQFEIETKFASEQVVQSNLEAYSCTHPNHK